VPMLPYSAKPATAVTTGNPESKEIDQTTKPGS
jgi:hypothetical protein